MLVQPLEIRIDRTLGSDPARLAVVYPSGDQRESRIAADTGFPAVVQVAGTNLHGPLPLIAPAWLLSRLALLKLSPASLASLPP